MPTDSVTDFVTSRANMVALNSRSRKGLDGADLPRGTYARIGRRLRPQVSGQFVGMVDRGEKTSARVAAALRRERERLQQQATQSEAA